MPRTPKKSAKGPMPPSTLDEAAVATRAYFIWQQRPIDAAQPTDDWLEAERQLRAESPAAVPAPRKRVRQRPSR